MFLLDRLLLGEVCKNYSRDYIGIEMSKTYCEIGKID